jgi:ABC-type branched-subunit amino acid transport system substrate-binding protein
MVEGLGPAASAALAPLAHSDAITAFKAAADYVNAHGGAGGHQIQVDVCYDQGDPNLSATCARQAISNHDVSVTAPVILTSDSVIPILATAHIPYFGSFPDSPSDFSNSDSFPVNSGALSDAAGVGYILASHGCKKLGILYASSTIPEADVPYMAAAAEAKGATVVAKVSLPLTSVTASTQIAQIENAGADCVGFLPTDSQVPGIVLAVEQSGKSLMMGAPTGGFPSSVLSDLGNNATGVYLAGSVALPTDSSNPTIGQMLTAAKQYEGSSPPPSSSYAVLAWGDAQILFNDVIAKTKGAVTGQSVTAGIQALKSAGTGVTPPYTASTPPTLSNFPRLVNFGETFWQIKNGKPESITNGFVDISSSLKAASS